MLDPFTDVMFIALGYPGALIVDGLDKSIHRDDSNILQPSVMHDNDPLPTREIVPSPEDPPLNDNTPLDEPDTDTDPPTVILADVSLASNTSPSTPPDTVVDI